MIEHCRSINDNMVYAVFEPIEYSHILTVIGNLMSDWRFESLTYNELSYVYDSLAEGHNNFCKCNDINILEGGDEDEDEQ